MGPTIDAGLGGVSRDPAAKTLKPSGPAAKRPKERFEKLNAIEDAIEDAIAGSSGRRFGLTAQRAARASGLVVRPLRNERFAEDHYAHGRIGHIGPLFWVACHLNDDVKPCLCRHLAERDEGSESSM